MKTPEKQKNDAGSSVEDPISTDIAIIPINAPPVLVPHLPPDTPSESKNKDARSDSDDDPVVLNKFVQCGHNVYDRVEFVLEESIGPALKFAG